MTNVQLQQQLNEIKKLIKTNFTNEKEVLTSSEVTAYLNISYSLLSKLSAQGLIPSYQPTNGKKFYYKNDLHDWIKANKILTEDDTVEMIKRHSKKRRV